MGDFTHKDNRLEFSAILHLYAYKFICPFQSSPFFSGLLKAAEIMSASPDTGMRGVKPFPLILLVSGTAMIMALSLFEGIFHFKGTTCKRIRFSLVWPHLSHLNNQLNIFNSFFPNFIEE